ncbi:MAG TPA: enoyl-CoA hydratase [Acetobacteraceae bacterium]|nr:enoyl-CoA hydratase [Acetobacteraceae bacterium]
MADTVVVSQDGSVVEIRLNRPEKKNALTRAMYEAVSAALERAEADAAIRVALLTGTGDAFTSGNDVKDFQERGADRAPRGGSRFLPVISSFQKPLIAAVNGAAIGVGTTMLLHCDLVLAARSARFVMPFTNLGLVPEAASTLLVPRLLGHQRASALLLLGEPLDAETAFAWGLVNRVVDDASLMSVAYETAQRLAALPPQAVRLTKRLLKHGAPDVAGRIEEEIALFGERLASPEAQEAFAAFMEKRKPDFSRFS